MVVLRDTPRMKQNIPECLSAANRSVADCTTPLSEALRPDPIVMAIERMPVNTSGLTYLDLTDQIGGNGLQTSKGSGTYMEGFAPHDVSIFSIAFGEAC